MPIVWMLIASTANAALVDKWCDNQPAAADACACYYAADDADNWWADVTHCDDSTLSAPDAANCESQDVTDTCFDTVATTSLVAGTKAGDLMAASLLDTRDEFAFSAGYQVWSGTGPVLPLLDIQEDQSSPIDGDWVQDVYSSNVGKLLAVDENGEPICTMLHDPSLGYSHFLAGDYDGDGNEDLLVIWRNVEEVWFMSGPLEGRTFEAAPDGPPGQPGQPGPPGPPPPNGNQ